MDSTDIKKIKESLDKTHGHYKSNFAYAHGKNPKILTDPVKKDPDNRIPIPLAKMAVTDLSGYAGRAGDTTVKILDDGVTTEQKTEYEKLSLSIFEHNKTDLETAELYEESLTQGVAYELFWTSDDITELKTVTPEYKIVSALEIVPIFTSSLKPELSHAIRYWKTGETDHADVYEPLFVTHYIRVKESEEYKIDVDKGIEGTTEYPYKTVPLAIYPINRHTFSLFDAEKPIIDAHDDLISKSTNEIDRFNAMKLLMPGLVTKEMADKISSMGIFQNLGDDKKSWPEYLEKNLGGIETFYNALADRLERLFHKSIKIPDMTAESFAGGAQSGVAIAYKLIGMEFKASQIDTYFDQGINKRIELINDILESSYSYVADIKIKITHKRNLPIDEAAKVELALKLKGNISDEAYLRLFPKNIIPNVKEELDRLEEAPDKQLLELFVLALDSGNKVPAQLIADALKIDRAEWLKLTTEEQKARIEALASEDDNIEESLDLDGE
jgi:SPP1 family phage portal protein